MSSEKIVHTALIVGIFFIAFLAVPYSILDHGRSMPGDIGDARLNNYFLENIYQYLAGRSPSLIDLNFFYPFPFVLGFSDNLFGSSPVYLAARLLTGQPDTAYQIWFLAAYPINYCAAYYALRKLGIAPVAAIVGALVFTFALPTSVKIGHAQLHYRFGVPLAISYFLLFLQNKSWRHLVVSGAWLVWQFYCTIYIGFFLLVMLACILAVYLAGEISCGREGIRLTCDRFVENWQQLSRSEAARLLILCSLLFALLGVLFYPYIEVTHLYDAKRSVQDIQKTLPRLQSYFLADASWLWSSSSRVFAEIPIRHEHQWFAGAIPLVLAFAGILFADRSSHGSAYFLMGGALALAVAITLSVGGYSLWLIFAEFPLASAIRAMARIGLVFLFPLSYFASIGVERLLNRKGWGPKVLFIAVLPAMLFEFHAISPGKSAKVEWRQRVVAAKSLVPHDLPENPVIFFANRPGSISAGELDAMWVALQMGVPTMNGYSGFYPPGYSFDPGTNCIEIPLRILAYLNFIQEEEIEAAYLRLAERIVPIGFKDCSIDWRTAVPKDSISLRDYTVDEFKRLSLRYLGLEKRNGLAVIRLEIVNDGTATIASRSVSGHSVRLSWRVVDQHGLPLSGWDRRLGLPAPIPAKGKLNISVPLDAKDVEHAGGVQVGIVQEGIFWGHDVGVPILTIDLRMH